MDTSSVEGIDELNKRDVAITLGVCLSYRLLEWNPLLWEGNSSDLVQDLLRPVLGHLSVVLDLLLVVSLDQSDLNDSSMEWIMLIQDDLDLLICERV